MFHFLVVKHTITGDVVGQMLSYENYDSMLLEYHSQMKNAINNPDINGMSINVLDDNMVSITGFPKRWVRGAKNN